MLMTLLMLVLAISGGLFLGILIYSGYRSPLIITGPISREGGELADLFRRLA
jgi:hypothetical protein